MKRSACGAGFTELGRFSATYRRFFGDLPSANLEGAPHSRGRYFPAPR